MTDKSPLVDHNMLALGIQQPWAELIVRGLKTIEVRKVPVAKRGRILLYSSQRLSTLPMVQELAEQQRLSLQGLHTGCLVGSVELVHCRPCVAEDATKSLVPWSVMQGQYSWELANPERIDPPVPPRYLPYGMWFYPFIRKSVKSRNNRER